jgi:hypothetical protein
VRCDRCGRTKSIRFDKLGELHIRYLKGLETPYSMATEKPDTIARESPPGPPITRDEYYAGVELAAGHRRCRGTYRLDAPPRCPKCRSTNISEGGTTVMYD